MTPGVVFTNVSVLDGSGEPAFAGEVMVQGDRIVQVGAAGAVAKDGIRTIDGRGGTLMPGLCDAHAHITWINQPNRAALRNMPAEDHTVATVANARTYLDYGYTMAVSAASARPRLDMVVRDAINRGEIPGPRLLANGPVITTNRDLNEVQAKDKRHFVDVEIIDSAATMEACVERVLTQPLDFVKVTMSGEEITGVPARQTLMTDDEAGAAVRTAARHGARVCAHARSAEAVKICVRQGIPLIYHASYSDEETLDALEEARDRVFVAPGINWLYATCYEAERWNITPQKAESLGYVEELEAAIETMKRIRRRGVRILPGGDYGFAWCPHGTYSRDLEHFVRLFGFSPMEAIVSATRQGAELFGRPGELGQIQPGFVADLLLVDGDPLKDIKVLQDRDRIAVMKGGVFHREPRR
jgi:imidazolonepropionase-like amidohydrolase